MKNISVLLMEAAVTAGFVLLGLSGKKILFIHGERSAILALGVIAMLFCTISVGKFIEAAPAHPLTILGYIFGTISMAVFIIQLFKWNVPVIGNPRTALIIMAVAIMGNSIIGRFYPVIKK